jgi:hypothetical protein
MLLIKVVDKIKTHILCSITFFSRQSYRLWDNVEKCCKSGQTTDDNTTRRMRFASPITKATDTHSEYVILTAFPHDKNGYANAPQCKYTRTFPLMLRVRSERFTGNLNIFPRHLSQQCNAQHRINRPNLFTLIPCTRL